MTNEYKLYIGGKWVDSVSGKTFTSISPGTGQTNAIVAEANAEDVDLAVKAARKAFQSSEWALMAPGDRGRLLYKAAQLMREKLEFLAEIESREAGLTIKETTFVALPATIDVLEFYAGLANKVQGDTLATTPDRLNYTIREPLGVIGAIVPWNFPLMLSMWKLAPALAAGNTVVLKPAEQTPTSILELMKIFEEAGFPEGVINVVPGYGHTAGNALASHPDVDKIAFTGSTNTGSIIMQAAAKNLKPLSLELGGKSPNIVFEDADIQNAVNTSAFGIYFAQGQVCAAGSRLFVQDSVYDDFMHAFLQKAKAITVGNPLEMTTDMGPQVSQSQLERIENYVSVGLKEGASLLTGGERFTGAGNGFFYTPTILENVSNDMTIAKEEIFGPVVSIIRFKDEQDALEKANDSIYGLAAGVWTNDIKRGLRMARNLQAGSVWVNTYNLLDSAAPFGGTKQSGFGRELGIQAMDMYTQTKSVWVDLAPNSLDWFG